MCDMDDIEKQRILLQESIEKRVNNILAFHGKSFSHTARTLENISNKLEEEMRTREKDFGKLEEKVDKHIEIYANNGKELRENNTISRIEIKNLKDDFSEVKEIIKNLTEKILKIEPEELKKISQIDLNEVKDNTKFRNKIYGALAVLSFIGVGNLALLVKILGQ